MAAIGSIRKHSTLLVIVIGGALAAFVLGDFMKGGGRRDITVGTIAGEHVTIMDFNKKVDENLETAKRQQQKNVLTTNETYQVRQATWDQMVHTILMDKEYKELGIEVTPQEMSDLVQGAHPSPVIQQYFINPNTGKFDRNRVNQFLQQYDQLPEETKQQWNLILNYIKEQRLAQKFNALIAGGYYIPEALAQVNYDHQNSLANITYVAARYSGLPDSLVNVTESDYETYYNAHKEEFKQKASRSIEYVAFNVTPSPEDIAKAKNIAEETRTDFIKTNKPVDFAKANSDKSYDTAWIAKGLLPQAIDDVMFSAQPGTVSEPYFENNSFIFARLLKKERRPDSLSASHILIAYKGAYRANPEIGRTKAQAEKLADSLLTVLKRNPARLGKLAKEYSDDPSVKQNDGKLGWFADGQMVPAFNEAVINTQPGNFTIAETPFGFHIIKVDGKKDYAEKVKVALITQDVVPSTATYQKVFAQASELATSASDLSGFESAANKSHYALREAPNVQEASYTIPGLNNPREIVRWAFKDETETGKVSNVFDLGDQYVVAVVTKKYHAGIPSLDQVKSRIEPFVVNKVKGKYLANKMEQYKGNLTSMEKGMNLQPQEMTNLAFDSRNIVGFGMEDKVIGSVFGMKQGQTSQPIVGNAAAFVVKADKMLPAGKLPNYNQYVQSLYNTFAQRVYQGYPYVALKNTATIEDNRVKFY
ncbi:MAG: SurA N-terminal domain-containing protein [Bacteroidales bacterium]|nr:SurA N-terminal domain-containing protein [Bacteroidales bacterium]